MLISVREEYLDKLNVPFKLIRLKKEKRNLIGSIRSLFDYNYDKEYPIKEVMDSMDYVKGMYCYKTMERVLKALEVEGYLTSSLQPKGNGGFKRYWIKANQEEVEECLN